MPAMTVVGIVVGMDFQAVCGGKVKDGRMNNRKKWEAADEFKIVMEGLSKEVPQGELYGIRQSSYHR